jgi:hypothetical protein
VPVGQHEPVAVVDDPAGAEEITAARVRRLHPTDRGDRPGQLVARGSELHGPAGGQRLDRVDDAVADQQARPGAVGAHHGLQGVHLVGRQRSVGIVVETPCGPVGGA